MIFKSLFRPLFHLRLSAIKGFWAILASLQTNVAWLVLCMDIGLR